ncbi:MAG: UDP-N-acetylmuramate--L-alanine ligase [Bacteroidales bacterium]|jgi:UDP-N-acetylmuramate--alanine ligase|nr:UDP-N-acetylmuramate--L-alanine ligase [Bacteroidales bacterium]
MTNINRENISLIEKCEHVYFLGIGGIGMSALAYYFLRRGCAVSGYDLTPSPVTEKLIEKGAIIHYDEKPEVIPIDIDLVIHTPAVSKSHAEYRYFEQHGIPIYKRAAILGMISATLPTIAVAGTHGKTTTTALLAHLSYPEEHPTAFVGGISKNFGSNFLTSKNPQLLVVEADEYDRSFLSLFPNTAIITAMDADHLDIYKETASLEDSFREFAKRLPTDGTLVLNYALKSRVTHNKIITYGFEKEADYHADKISILPDKVVFDLYTPEGCFKDLQLGITGYYNLLNALSAIAAMIAEKQRQGNPADIEKLISKLATFKGVHRRFDYQVFNDKAIYIDDYAHHPEEIRSFLRSVRDLFPDKVLTGIFQPHLYSRTRDFAPAFAKSLEALDEIILLDIYPAREEPIPHITSEWLLSLIQKEKKMLLSKTDLLAYLKNSPPELLVTIGAGDIDRLVPDIKEIYTTNEEYSPLENPNIYPDKEVLTRVLGDSYPAYEQLLNTITGDEYNLKTAWNFYPVNNTWLCRCYRKKRTVFWLSVWENYFRLTFYFTQHALKRIAALDLDKHLKLSLGLTEKNTPNFPVIVSFNNETRLEDVLKIIHVKKYHVQSHARHKKQKPKSWWHRGWNFLKKLFA